MSPQQNHKTHGEQIRAIQKTTNPALPAYTSPDKSHGLIGLPLGSVVPEDEFLHPAAPSGHYASTETSYFGFNIPERRLNGEVYMWFHPVLKVICASVYIWTAPKSTLACEYINHHHYLPWLANGIADYRIEAVGLHIRVIEPLKSVQIDFEDKARNVSFDAAGGHHAARGSPWWLPYHAGDEGDR